MCCYVISKLAFPACSSFLFSPADQLYPPPPTSPSFLLLFLSRLSTPLARFRKPKREYTRKKRRRSEERIKSRRKLTIRSGYPHQMGFRVRTYVSRRKRIKPVQRLETRQYFRDSGGGWRCEPRRSRQAEENRKFPESTIGIRIEWNCPAGLVKETILVKEFRTPNL